MANEWNIGEQRKKGIKQEAEFALLVGVIHKSQTEELVEECGVLRALVALRCARHPERLRGKARSYAGCPIACVA